MRTNVTILFRSIFFSFVRIKNFVAVVYRYLQHMVCLPFTLLIWGWCEFARGDDFFFSFALFFSFFRFRIFIITIGYSQLACISSTMCRQRLKPVDESAFGRKECTLIYESTGISIKIKSFDVYTPQNQWTMLLMVLFVNRNKNWYNQLIGKNTTVPKCLKGEKHRFFWLYGKRLAPIFITMTQKIAGKVIACQIYISHSLSLSPVWHVIKGSHFDR